MKCLIVVPSLIRAGAETQAVDLANGLAERGHSVHLCSFESRLDQLDRVSSDVRFHHIIRRSRVDRAVVAFLTDIIDREEIDVVVGVMQYSVLIAWLAAQRSRRSPPIVAAIHTTINKGIKEELQDRYIYRYLLRRAAAVIFVCEHQRAYWLRRCPELDGTARVVHNGVDASRFQRKDIEIAGNRLRRELHIAEAATVFACVAAFRPEKGQHQLLRAFRTAPVTAYLIFAGDGPRKSQVERAAFDLGLSERVRFLGSVPDVRPVIVASDATVLSSTAVETFSMAMLESMALGVPMIAPCIGGLSEAIQHGETGFLYPVGDFAALARMLRELTQDRRCLASLGTAAATMVRSRFTRDQMLTSTEEILREVLIGQRNQGGPRIAHYPVSGAGPRGV